MQYRSQSIPMMTRVTGVANGDGRINQCWNESESPRDNATVLGLLCARIFDKFGILTLIFLPIFRRAEGTKLGFVPKE